MTRNKQIARKSTRGPPHPIHHPQEVSDQEESEQLESKYVILEDNDDNYAHHEGGWVDTDTEEEPMELPGDHPEVSSGSNEDPAGGDSADPSAASRDENEDGDDDSDAPDGGDDDPNDDPEPAVAASPPPPEPHYAKQIHRLDFAEGPLPVLLWRAMQRIGFPQMPHYEAHLYKNAQQEEWLVAMVISVLDERHGSRVEYSKHIDDVPRRTLDAGTSEAARRALYYLCHTYREELQGTEFQLFPRCKRGATYTQIPALPPGEGSLLVDTMQELVTALSTDLDAAGAEIQEVKRKLMKTIRGKAILEAQLRGDPELPA
jgi:hypothetical protein